jgi:hypothetical protein
MCVIRELKKALPYNSIGAYIAQIMSSPSQITKNPSHCEGFCFIKNTIN